MGIFHTCVYVHARVENSLATVFSHSTPLHSFKLNPAINPEVFKKKTQTVRVIIQESKDQWHKKR